MIRLVTLAMAALAGSWVLAQEPVSGKPPEEEYLERLAKIQQSTADEHAAVGNYLTSAEMHDWARVEYKNATDLVPAHEKANKGLGFTVWNEETHTWEPDLSKTPTTGNKKKGEQADKIWLEYQKKLEQLGRNIGKKYWELGSWCQRQFKDDTERARKAFEKAVEYDPTNKESRLKLGYKEQKGGGWLSEKELKIRKEMREGIAKAPKGQPDNAPTDVETKLGLKCRKQAGEDVLIESPHLDQKTLEILIQHSQHAYKMFHEVLKQNKLFGQRQTLTILKDKSQHEKFVDVFGTNWPAEEKRLAKDCIGCGNERFQADRTQAELEDWVIHRVIMMCSESMAGGEGRHWLHEGLAYYFTLLMHGSAATHCTSLRSTGPGEGNKDFSDASVWPVVIRDWLDTGKDPDIHKVFKCNRLAELRGGDPVKAWSLCEFLVTEHPDKLIDFMQKIRAVKLEDDEKTFKEVFGWTLEEFNRRWRVFARATYGKKK
ncbi:MAG: hypothetical protein HYY16_13415 [Planctomycetes bacterium]|nr:hypothetical protein [Planctomycetota bacterium]